MKSRDKKPISISSPQGESRQKKPFVTIALLVTGILIGAAGWAQGALLIEHIEPWDSGIGILVNQALFTLTAFLIGSRAGCWKMFLSILSMYCGQLLYIWYFGSDDQRSWFRLCMLTTTVCFVIPLLFGIAGSLYRFNRQHGVTLLKRKTQSS